jgi:hypothetical protein
MEIPKLTTTRVSLAHTGRSEIHTEFLWGNLKDIDTFEDKRWKGDNIKMDLKK